MLHMFYYISPMKGDEFYMQQALELATRARGETYPNPMVGCVIVLNEQIVAEGFHPKAGELHAERRAILDNPEVDFSAPGTVLYVNLEPCCYHGRTPACSELIIEKKIPRVVFGMYDPNPKVAGKGVEKLRAAGIEVEGPVLEKECLALNRPFEKNILRQETYFSLKSASSLDGMMAMADGTSKWITGHDARQKVAGLRKACDGILVGVGTIQKDNPSLTIRLDDEEMPNRVIIIDKNLDCPIDARVFQKNFEVFVITASTDADKMGALENAGATIVQLALNERYFGRELAGELFKLNFHHVLVEGGSHINASFLKHGLVDEWHLFMAPRVLGGSNIPLFSGWSVNSLEESRLFELFSHEVLGDDVYLRFLRASKN